MGRLADLTVRVPAQMTRAFALVSLFVCVSCTQADKAKDKQSGVLSKARAPATSIVASQAGLMQVQTGPDATITARLRANAQAITPQNTESFSRFLFASAEQRKWAAFGLGRHCQSLDVPATSALLVQAMSLWMAESEPPGPALLNTAAWALGSCGDRNSEELLRPFLTPAAHARSRDLVFAGAFGLLALADRRGALSERTQTLILDAAQQEGSAELLAPLGRMGRLSDAVGAHLLEVAGRFLTQGDAKHRRSAIFALSGAGPSAAEPLAQVLLGHQYSTQERAAAAQALGLLGSAGQTELDRSITTMLARGLPTSHDHALWIPLISALNELHQVKKATQELKNLAGLVLATGINSAASAQQRRLIWLRCRAADLVADRAEKTRALLECDPDQGRTFALAQLRVLARAEITGSRLVAFEAHLKSADPVISQAALRLLPTHPELTSKVSWILSALQTNVPGSKTLAAQLIYTYPAWITNEENGELRAQLLTALQSIITQADLPQETRASALLAGGALGALNLKSLIRGACEGADPLLYESARTALGLLGEKNISCPKTSATQNASSLQASKPNNKVNAVVAQQDQITIAIDSDLGELRLILDPNSAPEATKHILNKIESGFYDQQRVGFGRYGLTVQFGDRDEDGYDETAAPDLPFEVSPQSFPALSLGMSSFAPGAEDTQLFVTLSAMPQLFGSRILLGRAEGPWELLIWGDELRSFKRLTK